MSFTAIDGSDGERLSGVSLDARRVDLSEPFLSDSAGEASRYEVKTDEAGFGQIDGFQFGEYNFLASLPGFESQEFTLSLPGPFFGQVEASGRADLGTLSMTRLTPFSVQLKGHEDWGGAAGFSIAHTHQGNRAYFGPDGLAQLELGWFSEPLYLKMWFPGDDQEAIAYLDGGMPPDGEPWIIDVAKDVTLDVDLRIPEEVLNRIDLAEATLRVTFRTARGDSTMLAVAANEPGVYSVPGLAGTGAMVQFVASLDGEESGLAIERIRLEEGKHLSCVLAVDALPTRLKIVDGNGSPLAGAHLELRERHGSTSWAFGVTADDAGELFAVLPPNLELSMRVISKDRQTVAVDRTITWEPSEGPQILRLDVMPPTRIRATTEGRPLPGVEFELFGAHSDQTFLVLRTEEDGQTSPIRVVNESTARIRLASPDLWMVDGVAEVRSGENSLRVYETGRLILSEPADVYHVAENQSVQSWVARGLVEKVGGATATYRVPSGLYRMVRSDGSTWEGTLHPGQVLQIP
ncbi:hypothetical protein Poly30_28640 [Planctomycetes bacterium Poly30]|uniref:Uncharacterized protein n=2 Tax=Saltatorellus ferox TaxID=2528018 RepID=A0A518ETC5_9BACT|nr:hypothetical protein Poly30_28640 [Planctomycetes bacterium Poly30]